MSTSGPHGGRIGDLPTHHSLDIPAGTTSLPTPHAIALSGATDMINHILCLLPPEIREDVKLRIEITLAATSPENDVRFLIDDIADRSGMQPTIRQNFLSAFAAMEAHLNAVKQAREGVRNQIAASLGIVPDHA